MQPIVAFATKDWLDLDQSATVFRLDGAGILR
jgi:hypothetical protein